MYQPSPEEMAKMNDMLEKFRFFLQKYEGFGLVISTCHYWKDGDFKMDSRIELTKIGNPPKIQTIEKVFS